MSAGLHDNCWKRIGTSGDRSCPELATHVHCRNCPTFSAGAARLLDVAVSPDYLAEHARTFAQRKEIARPGARSVVIFRLGAEWLALPTAVFSEVAPRRPVHSLPHRRDGVVTGVVNIRGELLICVALGAALQLGSEAGTEPAARLAVLNRAGERFVFVADEIAGLQRFDDADLSPVPATLAAARASFTRGMLAWRDTSVGVLDDERLFQSLNHRLA